MFDIINLPTVEKLLNLLMLHMEIIQERLEREFNMTVITTVPNVSYGAH